MTKINWNAVQVVATTSGKKGEKPVRQRNADVRVRYMAGGSWQGNLSQKGLRIRRGG